MEAFVRLRRAEGRLHALHRRVRLPLDALQSRDRTHRSPEHLVRRNQAQRRGCSPRIPVIHRRYLDRLDLRERATAHHRYVHRVP